MQMLRMSAAERDRSALLVEPVFEAGALAWPSGENMPHAARSA